MPRISNEQKADFPLILEAHVCQLKFDVNLALYVCAINNVGTTLKDQIHTSIMKS